MTALTPVSDGGLEPVLGVGSRANIPNGPITTPGELAMHAVIEEVTERFEVQRNRYYRPFRRGEVP